MGKRPFATEPLVVKENGKAYTTATLLYWFRLALAAVGVKLTGVRGEELWGLHAFRRGGAQALAAAGWSCTTSQAWARWESAIISVYLAEAPLLASSTFASSMVGGTGVVREKLASRRVHPQWVDGPVTPARQQPSQSSSRMPLSLPAAPTCSRSASSSCGFPSRCFSSGGLAGRGSGAGSSGGVIPRPFDFGHRPFDWELMIRWVRFAARSQLPTTFSPAFEGK